MVIAVAAGHVVVCPGLVAAQPRDYSSHREHGLILFTDAVNAPGPEDSPVESRTAATAIRAGAETAIADVAQR